MKDHAEMNISQSPNNMLSDSCHCGTMNNRSNKSLINDLGNENKPEGRVLVLYTGGTIGMMRNEQGGKNTYIKFL